MSAVVFAFMLCACQRHKVLFSELAEIGGGGWTYQDSIEFKFSAEDTTRVYALNLEVTHDREYAWENLYVMIHTVFPGDSIKTDILSLELSDGSGAWVGRCSDDRCTLTIPLQERMRFPVPGPYGLTFIQHMRQEIVPGIYGLELSVIEEPRSR